MNAALLPATPLAMPIDGISWSWRLLTARELPPLLPFVAAADPSGSEASRWPKEALAWLAEQPCRHGLVGIQCLAELTLALFFFKIAGEARGGRRLAVHRLRWVELARPHRSLDATLTILGDTAERLDCADILIEPDAAAERVARQALDARAERAGFARRSHGWQRPVGG